MTSVPQLVPTAAILKLNTTAVQTLTSSSSIAPVMAPVILSTADIISLVLLAVTFMVGVLGNGLVIHVFGYKHGSLRTRFEAFLLILAVVDLMASLLIPTSFTYLTATGMRSWHFGAVGCKLIPSLLQISITVSQGVLLLISWERYQSIVYPFRLGLTNTQVACWLVVVALASVALIAPYMSTFKLITDPVYSTETCSPDGGKQNILLASSCMLLARDCAAIIAMTVLGCKMHRALVSKWNGCNYNRAELSVKGRRLLRMVVAVFVILTLPVDLFQVVVYSLYITVPDISPVTYQRIRIANTFLVILQASNSFSNVFIYSRMHSAFKKYITCQRDKQKRSTTASINSTANNTPTFRTGYYETVPLTRQDTIISHFSFDESSTVEGGILGMSLVSMGNGLIRASKDLLPEKDSARNSVVKLMSIEEETSLSNDMLF